MLREEAANEHQRLVNLSALHLVVLAVRGVIAYVADNLNLPPGGLAVRAIALTERVVVRVEPGPGHSREPEPAVCGAYAMTHAATEVH